MLSPRLGAVRSLQRGGLLLPGRGLDWFHEGTTSHSVRIVPAIAVEVKSYCCKASQGAGHPVAIYRLNETFGLSRFLHVPDLFTAIAVLAFIVVIGTVRSWFLGRTLRRTGAMILDLAVQLAEIDEQLKRLNAEVKRLDHARQQDRADLLDPPYVPPKED